MIFFSILDIKMNNFLGFVDLAIDLKLKFCGCRFQMLRDLMPHSDQKRDKASFLLEVYGCILVFLPCLTLV